MILLLLLLWLLLGLGIGSSSSTETAEVPAEPAPAPVDVRIAGTLHLSGRDVAFPGPDSCGGVGPVLSLRVDGLFRVLDATGAPIGTGRFTAARVTGEAGEICSLTFQAYAEPAAVYGFAFPGLEQTTFWRTAADVAAGPIDLVYP
jgi:hypothetical protein